MMKRLLVVLLCLNLSGCAAWWNRLKDDPIAALTEGTGYLMNALSLAELAFSIWAAGNPNADPGTVQQFHALAGNVHRGIGVAQAGLRIGASLQHDVDAPTLLHDAQDGIGAVATFLQGLPAPPGGAADPTMAAAIANCSAASRR